MFSTDTFSASRRKLSEYVANVIFFLSSAGKRNVVETVFLSVGGFAVVVVLLMAVVFIRRHRQPRPAEAPKSRNRKVLGRESSSIRSSRSPKYNLMKFLKFNIALKKNGTT